MSWALISDSSCNLRDWQPTAPHTTFAFAPLKIRVGEREFVDDLSLDVHELNCAVQAESSAGGKMDLIFLLFDRYLASNPDVSFEDACAYFDSLEQNSKILFSLCNYENLAKAGRIPKAAGVIANKLNIRILGTASEAGKIELVGHTRGEKKMLTKIVDTMEAEGFTGGKVIIDHVENEAGAQALADRIVERWPGSKPIVMPCNGLDSYYAEMHGLIIGYGMGVASGR